MQKKIPAIYMQGGTSKGLFFHAGDLPPLSDIRDAVLLAAYGSPDPNRRQIDGVGGAVSTASKVAILSPSESPDYDVVYNFGQVSIFIPVKSEIFSKDFTFTGVKVRYLTFPLNRPSASGLLLAVKQ